MHVALDLTQVGLDQIRSRGRLATPRNEDLGIET
jgi:hypothetical protein